MRKTFSELINSGQPVLADFYADWCMPCKTMSPILKDVAQQLKDKAVIIKIDVDSPKNAAVVSRYGITSIPTLMLFKDGKNVWQQSGVTSATDLQQVIQRYAE
ncbi:MAG: thioredoxin [Candidatus Kapabacteria bacterium]|nr:thioredoxin [Candidatus Kapabacteria bacterium]